MTSTQPLRARRSGTQTAQGRKEARETLAALVALVAIIVALVWAGTLDYQDDADQIAYWEGRGVTVARW